MNKLFTKIASLALGAAMAFGVGVAVASNSEAVPVEASSSSSSAPTNATWSHVMSSGDLPVTASGSKTWSSNNVSVTWSTTCANTSAYVGFDNTKGVQLGSGTAGKTIQSGYTISASVSSFGTSKRITKMAIGMSNSSSGGYSGTFKPSTDTWSGTATSVTYYTSAAMNVTSGNITFDFSSTKQKAVYVKAIYVWFENATTQYTASLAANSHATLSGTTTVNSGSALNITIVPDEHYHLPTSLTSVTMGGSSYAGYTYNNSTGAFSIASVTGAVVITGPCIENDKVTVTYVVGSNGTGTGKTISNVYTGEYELPAFSSFSEVEAKPADGYSFKSYSVGGDEYNAGESFSLSSATTITINFVKATVYTLVSDATKLADGTKFILASTEGGNVVIGNAISELRSSSYKDLDCIVPTSKTTISDALNAGSTMVTSEGLEFTLHGSAGDWQLEAGGEYLALTGTSNGYNTFSSSNKDTNNAKFTITSSGNAVKINSNANNTRYFKYNAGTDDFRNYADGSGTDAYMFAYIPPQDVLDEDLTIDNPETAFTVGDTFEIGDTVYANYSISGDVDVTSDVTLDLAGVGTISEGDTITSDWVGTKEVGVYYEDEGGAEASAAYDITVSYAKVTSVEITNYPSTGELPKDGEFTFGATVLPATANPTVKWSASSETLTVNDDFYIDEDTGELTLTASDGGTLTITATTVGKTSGDVSLTDSYELEITGDPVVTLNHSELSGFSGKTGSLTAEAANFSGTVTYSWSSNNACVTVPNSNVATNTLTYVSAGTATITVTATYGQSESASASCTVVVTASTVTSVQWTNSSNMTVYSGSTALNAAKITSWAPTYSMNNGDPDAAVPAANYDVYLNGSSYTLGSALAAGTYTVTLSYGGKTTNSSNPILTVVQSLNTITAPDTYLWEANGSTDDFTSSSTTLNGVTWTNTVPAYSNKAAGTVDKRYIQIGKGTAPEDFTIRTSAFSGTITKVTVDCASGDNKHTIAISVGGTTYLEATQTPKWSSNAGGEMTGTGSSSGEIVIAFDHVDNTKAMYIHSIEVETSGNVANAEGHIEAQSKVVEFAQYMNEQMNGTNVCSGTGANLSTAWGNVTSKYNTLFGDGSSLSSSELAFAKKMLANASANWNESHDSDEQYCLERAMKTYEWCISERGMTAFMSAVRTVNSARITPLATIVGNSNTVAMIVVISMISIAAIGGYFFLRKRKED